MKNHRYRVEDQDFVVSEEEHEKIKSLMAQGKSIIQLQSGSMVNLSYFKYEKETDRPLDTKEDVMALRGELNILDGPAEKRDLKYLNETHEDFYSRMKWPHTGGCCERAELRNKSNLTPKTR